MKDYINNVYAFIFVCVSMAQIVCQRK